MTESADKQRGDGMAQGMIDDPGTFRALTGRGHELAALYSAVLRGSEALVAVLDYDPQPGDDDAVDALISRCHTWCTALRDTGELARPALQAVPSATAPLT